MSVQQSIATVIKPTIPQVLPIMRDFSRLPGNEVGGSLHMVLDDGNVKDSDIRYCIEYARERGDGPGECLGELLLRMSKRQRRKLADLFYVVDPTK